MCKKGIILVVLLGTTLNVATLVKAAPSEATGRQNDNVETPVIDKTPVDQPGDKQPGADQPGGNPPVVNPPGGNPPVVNPPGGNPPVVNPPGGNPPGGNPPGGNPPGGNPPGGNPPEGNPPTNEVPTVDAPIVLPPTVVQPGVPAPGVQIPVPVPNPEVTKPIKPTHGKPTHTKPKPSDGEDSFGNCWSCLFDVAEDICSYLIDWTGSSKYPSLDIYSWFNSGRSSESDSSSDSDSSEGSDSSVSSFFRFKRTVLLDSAHGEEGFLDLLHKFYLKARERFARENPSVSISPNSDNLYNRPDELVQVAAYILKVPKDKLISTYDRMKTKETGRILLQALEGRQGVLNADQRFIYNKSLSSLTPTSVSYFFKELLGSLNGVATGFTELVTFVLQNRTSSVPPNLV